MQYVDVTVFIYSYILCHPAQVVPYQIYDGGVFCRLLPVFHQLLFGIGEGCIQGSLHGIGVDSSALDSDEGFGRKADEGGEILFYVLFFQMSFIFCLSSLSSEQQFILPFCTMENFF